MSEYSAYVFFFFFYNELRFNEYFESLGLKVFPLLSLTSIKKERLHPGALNC